MAVTAYFYARYFLSVINQTQSTDWDTNTIKVALCTSAYTPNQDTHDYYNDLTNEVANGNGYTTGGATLASKTLTQTLNVVAGDAADTVWAASTITARIAVVYDATGGGADASRPLILWIDFGADVVSTNAAFTIVWHASGIFTITATDATGFP